MPAELATVASNRVGLHFVRRIERKHRAEQREGDGQREEREQGFDGAK